MLPSKQTLPQGKRLPTKDDYPSLQMPFAYSQDKVNISNIGAVTESPDNWNVVSFQEGDEEDWALIPGHEFSPKLYRGQKSTVP